MTLKNKMVLSKISVVLLAALLTFAITIVGCDLFGRDSDSYYEEVSDRNPDPAMTLAAQLDRLRTSAAGSYYILYVRASESLNPRVLDSANLNGRSGITLRLRSTGSQHTVSLASIGALFTVESGVTLVLENNVRLRGLNNTQSLVLVRSNGVFIMEGGEISGNRGSFGGGVNVTSGGTFTMRGGEISENNATGGGGVAVVGTFNMENGIIRNNSTDGNGGGVTVGSGGTFTMWNGGIYSNRARNGGGVHLNDGAVATFVMHNGRITGNRAIDLITSGTSLSGGGILLRGGIFTMNGGVISGNTVTGVGTRGGGVSINPSTNFTGTFNMVDGEIHSNTVIGGTLGATPLGMGGGVFVSRNGGIFTKTGGTIQGEDGGNGNIIRNTATGPAVTSNGSAVFAGNSPTDTLRRRMENTVWPGSSLSFDGSSNPPSYSGAWD